MLIKVADQLERHWFDRRQSLLRSSSASVESANWTRMSGAAFLPLGIIAAEAESWAPPPRCNHCPRPKGAKSFVASAAIALPFHGNTWGGSWLRRMNDHPEFLHFSSTLLLFKIRIVVHLFFSLLTQALATEIFS